MFTVTFFNNNNHEHEERISFVKSIQVEDGIVYLEQSNGVQIAIRPYAGIFTVFPVYDEVF